MYDEAQEAHPASPVRATSLPASKKRNSGPVLTSRRMVLAGLIGLSCVGGGALWSFLNAPSSPPISFANQSKTISIPSRQRGGQPPVMNSTPTPAIQPTSPLTGQLPPTNDMGANPTATPSPIPATATPSPIPVTPTPSPIPGTPTPAAPLSATITNIPLQVINGSTVSVVVTASQPGVSVTLHVAYSVLERTYDLSPQTSDPGGLATFSWSVPHFWSIFYFFKPYRIDATVEATANDTQGQSVQSPQVQVQVMPDDGGD